MAETTRAPAPKKAAAKAAKTGAVDAKVKKAGPKKAASGKAVPAKSAKKAPPRFGESKAPFDRKTISDEQRYRMIAEAAYFRAESRGFQSDHVRDWIEAERDIAILLGEDK